MQEYDLIVLGTGGAGYRVAIQAAKAGRKVAAIDRGPFGGTCSVRGCIPKKILSGTAQIADINRRLHNIGIMQDKPTMSWGELIKFKRTFTDSVPDSTVQGLKDAGVDVYTGSPRFTGDRELEVNGEQLKGENVHVAVGLEPAKLPIEGFEHLIDSDAFLELEELPKHILFVGAGYVSFEFAHAAARFGARVTMLHIDGRPLPMFDQDIVETLLEASKEVGIAVELNAGAQKIEKTDDGFSVTAANGQTYEADLVVHGAGRVPSVKDMNLEATNVEYDKRRGVKVNEYLQSTSNPKVYAAGDVAAAGMPLSPVGTGQAAIVAANLLADGDQEKMRTLPDYHATASVVFSTPATAKAGYLESEAKEEGIEFDSITNDLTDWFDSKRLGLKHAKSKVLVEKDTNKIIGAHLIAHNAEELINIFSLAIELGLTTEDLKKPIFAFPTSSDDMRSML